MQRMLYLRSNKSTNSLKDVEWRCFILLLSSMINDNYYHLLVYLMTLSELTKNQSARISHLPSDFHLSAQLIEQGFALNSEIAIAHKAPFNGPIAVSLHGTKMSLPMNIAAQIEVEIVK